jgi:hypothetical protein
MAADAADLAATHALTRAEKRGQHVQVSCHDGQPPICTRGLDAGDGRRLVQIRQVLPCVARHTTPESQKGW